ncbi:hypothetical protein [Thalassobaculum litoreum]|uniref:Uncharacterized protein n=1 Tax=Thalassobaculum litoreum DSM 18839 TaxID=1123362 RepID=A0A8G2BI07_9PROT|nr:hypothetical protein [Thalassobaculum litoreum]SDF83107.1 hypothetical protein SAMN05660686_02450 [Thalassobaculum litoreum DSM 18839]
MANYRNPFHKPHDSSYGPAIYETDATPEEYGGYLIYRRLPNCWDVVKDGVCITQRAGPNGARRAIDERNTAQSAINCEVAGEGEAVTITAGGYSVTIKAGEIEHCWRALSHYPERRARGAIREIAASVTDFAQHLARLAVQGGAIDPAAEAETFAARHVPLWRAAWSAESRCASAFIVGPAKFPVRSNEKKQASSDRRYQEIRDHLANAKRATERRAFPHGRPDGPIRGSNPDAVDLLRAEIAKREERQEMMKAANKAIRAAKTDDEEALADAVIAATGLSRSVALKVVAKNYIGRRGFEGFELSNNNAEIRRLQGRLSEMEAKQSAAPVETSHNTTAGAVEVVENVEADRIQLIFPGKPDEATRSVLKSAGFRWSPRFGAWQRHLNNAGRDAVRRVLGSLQIDKAA